MYLGTTPERMDWSPRYLVPMVNAKEYKNTTKKEPADAGRMCLCSYNLLFLCRQYESRLLMRFGWWYLFGDVLSSLTSH